MKLSNKDEDGERALRKQLEAIEDEKLALEEKLQLKSASWLYSHHRIFSICFGLIYGAITASLFYLIWGAFNLIRSNLPPGYDLIGYILGGLFIVVVFGMPTIAILPSIVLLKAPKFALNSMLLYAVSYFLFEGLIFYADPLFIYMPQFIGIDRWGMVFPLGLFQFIPFFFCAVFAPQIVKRCGHRLVLNGSAFNFEVNADITAVSKQLEKAEEDFNLVLDRSRSGPSKLFFEKPHEKKEILLQILLQPKQDKTYLVLVMHSIINDVPMRAGHDEVERLGRTLMKWLEVSGDFTILDTQNESLLKQVVEESKKSFYRQPLSLPSKRVAKGFLRDHWKDIVIIVSLAVAILSWFFPFK